MNKTFNSPFFAIIGLLVTLMMGSQTATAQGFVVGGGLAKECYESVRDGYPPSKQALDICDYALSAESLNRRDRAATIANRGVLRMRLGRHEAALRDFDRALNLAPDMLKANINKGAALIYLKDFSAAIDALNTGLKIENPHDQSMALYNRAIAHEAMGDVSAAYSDFQEALVLFPEFELAQRQLTRFVVQDTDIQ